MRKVSKGSSWRSNGLFHWLLHGRTMVRAWPGRSPGRREGGKEAEGGIGREG